jgi:hypothetical protein
MLALAADAAAAAAAVAAAAAAAAAAGTAAAWPLAGADGPPSATARLVQPARGQPGILQAPAASLWQAQGLLLVQRPRPHSPQVPHCQRGAGVTGEQEVTARGLWGLGRNHVAEVAGRAAPGPLLRAPGWVGVACKVQGHPGGGWILLGARAWGTRRTAFPRSPVDGCGLPLCHMVLGVPT